ncbi:exopolysaccharide biosynthesis protein [Frigidibacter albus]|uniref:Exopolysaccharide biosynthesis protein n=2 Tax=Frigidibacter albus TaxID=1465486 RepID=A0A6L8VFI9_9RHOB|nr:exopolysaccharide biosynthesis protein [Frigidibacter albus]NBE30816.1 exopolysaccharide biosynthesis protein [Frigidibacter albus]
MGRRRWVRRAAPPKRRLSLILAELAEDGTRERISVADLVQILQARAFGALLLVFALPNVLPAPPGTSGILGLPLLYLAAQMMLGIRPWLPPFISKRSMLREDFAALITRVTPILERAERLLVPRLPALSSPTAERIVGGLCLVLAIVLVLPIPLGNMLPAFAICLIALGILERDGVWILAGSATGLAALLIVYAVVYAMIKAAMFVIFNAF